MNTTTAMLVEAAIVTPRCQATLLGVNRLLQPKFTAGTRGGVQSPISPQRLRGKVDGCWADSLAPCPRLSRQAARPFGKAISLQRPMLGARPPDRSTPLGRPVDTHGRVSLSKGGGRGGREGEPATAGGGAARGPGGLRGEPTGRAAAPGCPCGCRPRRTRGPPPCGPATITGRHARMRWGESHVLPSDAAGPGYLRGGTQRARPQPRARSVGATPEGAGYRQVPKGADDSQQSTRMVSCGSCSRNLDRVPASRVGFPSLRPLHRRNADTVRARPPRTDGWPRWRGRLSPRLAGSRDPAQARSTGAGFWR
jgi:hypothetical protein